MKNSKIEHFSDLLREQNLPIACVTSPANIFYLTGFHCEPHERLLCLFVFPEDEPILVCPAMEMNAAKNAGWKNSIIGYTDAEDPWKNIGKELRKRKKTFSHIAIEADHLTVTRMKQVKSILPEAELYSIDSILLNMRLIKDDSEIKKMREAAKIADLAITAGVEALKEGISEIDVLSSIEANMKKNGVQKIPFDLIVLFGKKAADPHGVPGINTLKKGDFVLFDIGASYERYCSDMTRTFIFGSATDEQIEMYNTVLKAEEAAINQCKPGEIIGEIDKTARNIIKENGYGEYFLHRTGHGLGIEVHEIPSIHEKNEDILKEGMVITIEPGIYNPKIGGVRIEDDVVITNDGVEVLTKYPKELQIIG